MKTFLLIATLGLLLATSCASPDKSQREPSQATATETANLRILKSIPPVPGLERKEADEDQIAEQMTTIFRGFADKNQSAGTLHRSTHAKGMCFPGTFTVLSAQELETGYGASAGLAARLKKGLFAYDGAYPASIRFANADGLGRIQADTVGDVHGFSFHVQTPEAIADYSKSKRQDFMFNSTPSFATGGVYEFLQLVRVSDDLVYHTREIPNALFLPDLFRDGKLIKDADAAGKGLKSYATENYWGNLPYTHGPEDVQKHRDVVKFKATPCDLQGTQHVTSTDGLSADYLQNEIVQRAKAGQVCFLIQAQFMDVEKLRKLKPSSKSTKWMLQNLRVLNTEHFPTRSQSRWTATDWVESGGLLWDESPKGMPFHTVAKVTIPADTASVSCDREYINTRLHSNPDNQPLGSLARVRTIVEEVSRARRMGELR